LLKDVGKLTVSDFEWLKPEVKALVKNEGNIRILFDMAGFKGETAKACIADYNLACVS